MLRNGELFYVPNNAVQARQYRGKADELFGLSSQLFVPIVLPSELNPLPSRGDCVSHYIHMCNVLNPVQELLVVY